MSIIERAKKWEEMFAEGIDSNSDRIRFRMAFLNGASAALAELAELQRRAKTPEEFVRAWSALSDETLDAREQTINDAFQSLEQEAPL